MKNPNDRTHTAKLIDELENDPEWETNWAQEEMAWEHFPHMVEPLLDRLDAADSRTTERAVTALGWIGDERAVDPLLEVLRQEKADNIRAKAVTALGDIGCADALDPLLDAFEKASSHEIRGRAVNALGRVGADEELVDILFEYDGEDAEQVRLSVIAALGCSEAAFTARRELFDSGTPEERSMLAAYLGKCSRAREFEMLLDLLDDPEPEVRMFASQSIGDYVSLNHRDFEAESLHEALLRYLGLSSGDDQLAHAVQNLVDLTRDQNPRVRRQSTIALSNIGSKGLLGGDRRLVRRTLIERKENDESEDVRNCAEHALSYI